MGHNLDHNLYVPGPVFLEPATVMLHHLHGGQDAGRAGSMVAEQLLAALPAERVATFVGDEFIDYRSRRPIMQFEDWAFIGVRMPEIALDLLHTDDGGKILLLHGVEPDFRWDLFAKTVQDLACTHGVEQVISVRGALAAVAHTRPTNVNAHSNNRQMIPAQPMMLGTLYLPGSMDMFLERRLYEAGLDTAGLVANVPYYVAEAEFPQASAALIRQISSMTGLSLPVGDLEAAAMYSLNQINEEVEKNKEMARLCRLLEAQADSMEEILPLQVNPGSQRVPTPEEIGEQVESFLANAELKMTDEAGEESSLTAEEARALPGGNSASSESQPTQTQPDITPGKGRHRAPAPWDEDPTVLGNKPNG